MPEDELALTILAEGEIEIEGRMPWSSNATFLVNISSAVGSFQAIYKPTKGERPLWDFPSGLHRRELAAYQLSEAMGFGLVPPTLIRDGPYGEGSVQWFVDADHQQHYFTILENQPDLHRRLQQMAVFDFVANNTDRKSGHVLLANDGAIWGIDHGLCFASDYKLRTVIWDFAGQPLPPGACAALDVLAVAVPLSISVLLDDDEVEAISQRATWLRDAGHLPVDETGRRYPWPLV